VEFRLLVTWTQEFVSGLSVLSRGNLHEKLLWTFSLYDTNGDGIVTKDEMMDIVSAIYDLMGKHAEPSIDEHTARDHVERVFEVCMPRTFTRFNVNFSPTRYGSGTIRIPRVEGCRFAGQS